MADQASAKGAAPSISFEFFPPATPEGSMRLWRSVERLAPLGPEYVSVTYGAGGATRDRTLSAIQTIVERARLTVAGHLTCVGASREVTLGVMLWVTRETGPDGPVFIYSASAGPGGSATVTLSCYAESLHSGTSHTRRGVMLNAPRVASE